MFRIKLNYLHSMILLLSLINLVSCSLGEVKGYKTKAEIYYGENHLDNLKQLTFGGENAEAYFSYDNSELILQSTRDNLRCDAIFRMNIDGTNVRQISSGKGVTTCAFISPDNESVIYATTHGNYPDCPPKPDHSQGYVWALYEDYDIYKTDAYGNDIEQLTFSKGYDAEAVYSPQGDKIIFTSIRSGDLELFIMDSDGKNVKQITDQAGYDGGAFFSRDGKWIVWRSSRPKGKALIEYQLLLRQGLIRSSQLDLYIMKLDGGKPIRLTNNKAANFGPYWHPNGKFIIFASNMSDPKGRNFDLYTINVKTKKIERITYYEGFDGFPMFSYDGKKLVFASNRNGKHRSETNVFIVDWLSIVASEAP